jgi:transcription antitermination factor NusG
VSCDKNTTRQRLRNAALRKFRYCVGRDEVSLDEITKDYIDDFLSWAVKSGSSPKTIELYRDALRCLLIEQFPDAEGQFKQAFKKSPQRRGSRTCGLSVEQIHSLAKADFGDREDLAQARDLFMFCVYCGGLDYNAARSLTKASVGDGYLTLPTGLKVVMTLNIQSVIAMYDVRNCDILFPFCSHMSEVAYTDRLKEIGERFRMTRLKDHHSEAKAWLSLAKEMHVDTEVMAACAYKYVDVLTHYSGAVSDNQAVIDNVIKNVCNAVVDDTEHWYAMKLRDRVTPDQIQSLLCENEQHLACRHVKTYYPMEDIKVRVGGKWKRDTKAFIKNVLFFRTKKIFVNQLFRIVRNYAWIFRQTNSSMSPYAVISQHDMENFQRAISQFTDDISIAIVENSEIKVGKMVRLNSGEFAGCEGIIEGEEADANILDLRDFYVNFTSSNSFKFQIKVSESSLTILD